MSWREVPAFSYISSLYIVLFASLYEVLAGAGRRDFIPEGLIFKTALPRLCRGVRFPRSPTLVAYT